MTYSIFLWKVCTPDRLHLITTQKITIRNFIDHVEMCILWPAWMQVLSNKTGKVVSECCVGNRFYWIGPHRKRDSQHTLYCRFQYEISPKFIWDFSEMKLRLVKRGRSERSITYNVLFMNRSYKIRLLMVENFPVRELLERFFFSYNLIHG